MSLDCGLSLAAWLRTRARLAVVVYLWLMVRVKTMLRRDAALIAAFNDLVGDSRRRVLIGLMDGKGLRCIARTPGIGEALGREIARELAADGLTRVAQRGKIVLTVSGKRAALAALQPLKSAVMAGASQDNDDLF